VNAWLPKCPPTHIQIGWDYRFVSAVPPSLFIYIISACSVVRPESEILSYWQSGVYIRNGNIDVSVCQWKDKLVLQVMLMIAGRFDMRELETEGNSTIYPIEY